MIVNWSTLQIDKYNIILKHDNIDKRNIIFKHDDRHTCKRMKWDSSRVSDVYDTKRFTQTTIFPSACRELNDCASVKYLRMLSW